MKFYYLFCFQYLGFRYHGWSKQVGHKTVQGTIEEELIALLGNENFKSLGASRTDSMVSAHENYFELILEESIKNLDEFILLLNQKLPPDIKILKGRVVDSDFKIIQAAKQKDYHYYFSFGEKLHPFCSPYMAMINEELDIELMKKAARLFVGEHNFSAFCYRLKEGQSPVRLIDDASIEFNRDYVGAFFPEQSFVFKVKAKSFLRHQVRLMMGALLMVGMKELSLEELKEMLGGSTSKKLMTAPASGLVLHKIIWN